MKETILNYWRVLREKVGLPMIILIALTGSFFIYTEVRNWQRDREIEAQTERIAKYVEQANSAIEKASIHNANADSARLESNLIMQTLKDMSGNIKQLAENDRVINIRVNDLKNEYAKTRNPKKENSANSSKSALPVHQRENDALRADRELYGN